MKINLIDVLGRTIQVIKGTSTVGENDIEINLQQLSKGIYQLVFIQNEIQDVKKLVYNKSLRRYLRAKY